MMRKEAVEQDKQVKKDLDWLDKVKHSPKLQRKQARMVKKWARQDKIDIFISWYTESSARIVFAVILLVLATFSILFLIFFRLFPFFGRVWDLISASL